MESLSQINFGEIFTAASLAGAGAVALVTQWLKYVPVAWTSKFAIYINIVLSFIASIAVTGIPSWDGTNVVAFLVQWGTIALTAAVTYHLLVKPAVTKPQGNVAPES